MSPDAWRHELGVALDVVRQASLLARDIRWQIGQAACLKTDQSPVTAADFAVQAVVADRLAAEFPGDQLVAEEDATWLRSPDADRLVRQVVDFAARVVPGIGRDQVLSATERGGGLPAGRFWVLDPIDGTEGFIRGGQYVIALALVVAGHVEVGVMGCPCWPIPSDTGSLAYAVRGRGAFGAPLGSAGFTPLRVSACREPRTARVLRSYDDRHLDLVRFNRIVEILGVECPPVLLDSQAKHAVLASGQAELLLRIPVSAGFTDKIWDQAAGNVIVQEAGGVVTDLHGNDLDFGTGRLLARNYGVVASNAFLHPVALEAIERSGLARP